MRAVTSLHLLDGRPWADSPWVDPLSLLGCFTSFAVDAAGRVQDLDAHLRRLARDSTALLGSALPDAVVLAAAADHVERVGAPVRLRVAVLAQTPPLQPQDVRSLHLATTSRPLSPPVDRAWRLRTVQHLRTRPEVKAVDPYLQLHLKREARLAGFDDALLRRGEDLLEGTTWALVALTAEAAVTPADDVLPSIGAARVLAAAGLPVERRPLRRDELPAVRLLLAPNAVSPVVAVSHVDDADVRVDDALLAVLRQRCAAVPGDPLRR